MQGAPLNEADHCGDPPLLLAAGNGEGGASWQQRRSEGPATGLRQKSSDQCSIDLHAGHLTCCKLLLLEGADIEQRNVVSGRGASPDPR